MASITNQIIPVGGYNNVGANWISPITASQNIIVSDDSVGTAKVAEFDVTNKRMLFQVGGAALLHSNYLLGVDNAGTGFINMWKVNASDKVETDTQVVAPWVDRSDNVFHSNYLASDSDTQTAEFNPWDSSTHTSFTSQDRASQGVTADTPAAGRFRVAKGGTYEVDFGLILKNVTSGPITIKIKALTAAIYTAVINVPPYSSAYSETPHVFGVMWTVTANEDFSVTVDGGGVAIQASAGSYVKIKRID